MANVLRVKCDFSRYEPIIFEDTYHETVVCMTFEEAVKFASDIISVAKTGAETLLETRAKECAKLELVAYFDAGCEEDFGTEDFGVNKNE